MAGMLRVSRSRGALSGVLLALLGIWGGLVPLVGPYVHYAYTPDHAWRFTAGRVWLEILPAAGTLLGGLVLLASRFRPMALLGASLAAASGAWFAVGSALAPLWTNTVAAPGLPRRRTPGPGNGADRILHRSRRRDRVRRVSRARPALAGVDQGRERGRAPVDSCQARCGQPGHCRGHRCGLHCHAAGSTAAGSTAVWLHGRLPGCHRAGAPARAGEQAGTGQHADAPGSQRARRWQRLARGQRRHQRSGRLHLHR